MRTRSGGNPCVREEVALLRKLDAETALENREVLLAMQAVALSPLRPAQDLVDLARAALGRPDQPIER